MPVYVLFGGVREARLLLCWASQASSGDCVVSFVRATVAFVVSSNLPQRRGSSTGVLLVESWRSGALPGAQRRVTVAENALKHRLASTDIDVDGVTGVPLFFPQAHYNSSVVAVIINHELRCITGGIRGTTDKITRRRRNIQPRVSTSRS